MMNKCMMNSHGSFDDELHDEHNYFDDELA